MQLGAPSKTSTTSTGHEAHDRSALINSIFLAFERYWPNLWRATFADKTDSQEVALKKLNQIKRSWLHDLPLWIANKQAMRGLEKAHVQCRYPPSLAEFITLCSPSPADFGAPTAELAYAEACNSTRPRETYRWSHPVVYHAAVRVGWFELTSNPKKVALPLYVEKYKECIWELDSGVEFPHPATKRLSRDEDNGRELSKAENAARLTDLKNRLFAS